MDITRSGYVFDSVMDKLAEELWRKKAEANRLINLQSAVLIEDRIKGLKEKLLKLISFDLAKNKLHPETVDMIDMGEYSIEKIIIQSLPSYFVPLNLYKPAIKQNEHLPGVLVPVGHYIEGKSLEEIQILCANLAMQGFIAVTFDPCFQGERDAFPEEIERRSEKDKWVVVQHMKGAFQDYLLDEQFIKYYLWDGIRVLDYLCSRNDVDVDSIGCCGQSGGGLQTIYLSAIDERIKVLIPVHYITSTDDDIRVNGLGDAEQASKGLITAGLDKCSLLWISAPKPIQISAALNDIFPLEGTFKVYEELKRVYRIFGAEDRLELVTVNSEHYFSQEAREGCYRFLNKWLKKDDCRPEEREVKILGEKALSCNYHQYHSLNVLDLNRMSLEHIASARKGVADKDLPFELKKFFNVFRDEYSVNVIESGVGPNFSGPEKFALHTRHHFDIYGELSIKEESFATLLMLDCENIIPREFIEEHTGNFNVVMLKPFGSDLTKEKNIFKYDMQSIIAHCLFAINTDFITIRANEVLCCNDYLFNTVKMRPPVQIIGTGQGGIVALIVSLYEKNIKKVAVLNLLASYDSLFETKDYFVAESDIICGFSKKFDICDLIDANNDKSVYIINPMNNKGKTCSVEEIDSAFAESKAANTNLNVLKSTDHLGELRKYLASDF